MEAKDELTVNADSPNWTAWAYENLNGWIDGPIYSPVAANGLVGYNQGGYGIVNLALLFTYPNQIPGETPWVSSNFSGTMTEKVYCPNNQNAVGIAIYYQSGFGIIDAALIYNSSTGPQYTDWLTYNRSGDATLYTAICPQKLNLVGIKAREQGGYGLITVKAGFISPAA